MSTQQQGGTSKPIEPMWSDFNPTRLLMRADMDIGGQWAGGWVHCGQCDVVHQLRYKGEPVADACRRLRVGEFAAMKAQVRALDAQVDKLATDVAVLKVSGQL